MADVTLKYKGATIGELSESGSKTLETAGKYCEADILLEYVKSGGALPSSISKIDGGSFTVASDTKCSTYEIPTTLGEPAKYFIIWTDDLNAYGAIANKGVISALVNIRQFESASGTTRYGFHVCLQRLANGGTTTYSTTMNFANNPPQFTDNTMINFYVSDIYYIANKLYKWVAFA